MPDPDVGVVGAYAHRGKGDKARDVPLELARASRMQTMLYTDPGNGKIAQDYAAILSDLGRHDMALRIAGAASAIANPTRWRALAATSSAFADRIDIPNALTWAEKAFAACSELGDRACPAHEKLRLRLYVEQLRLGAQLVAKGADPRHDPSGFSRELSRAHLTTRTGKSER